jgi:hypothetical protein
MNLGLVFIALLFLVAGSKSQQTPLPAETHQFDFWVGDWKATGESYGPDGKPTHTEAENSITRTFDGHVVQENFRMAGFSGMSVSAYDSNRKEWHQTWVDNQGGYIPLAGVFGEGKMTLQTLPFPKRPKTANRMVFHDIKPDSFDWDWESTSDGGKTWKLQWHLHYSRVKK